MVEQDAIFEGIDLQKVDEKEAARMKALLDKGDKVELDLAALMALGLKMKE